MLQLDLMDVNDRGDKDFDALSELEQNLYVLLLFFTLHEMEGITHFFSHRVHHLPRLLAFLGEAEAPNWRAVHDVAEFLKMKAGGSWDPETLENFFCNMSKEDHARLNQLDDEYYSKVQEMWARVREYVRERHGVDYN